MFTSVFERGDRSTLVELPPTLQPHAIAVAAPSPDHLRAAGISGLFYGLLVATGVVISSLAPAPQLTQPPPPDPGPIIVYDPPLSIRVTLPHPGPAQGRAGGVEPTIPIPIPAPTEAPSASPAGLPTENHSLDAGVAGPSPTGAGTAQGSTALGLSARPMIQDFTAVGLAVLHQVDPVYPEFARRAHIQGPVVLMVMVDELGQPTQVQVLAGHPVFHEAAMQAARQWRFEPAYRNGRPVAATFRLTLLFSLR